MRVEERRRFRDPVVPERDAPPRADLSAGQRDALEAIASRQGRARRCVLDGVTGSGKTEVYLRAIERVLADGGGAIVLVPEISLTPQTVGRFRSRFGDAVAVLHSRLSAGERYDQWDLVRRGEAPRRRRPALGALRPAARPRARRHRRGARVVATSRARRRATTRATSPRGSAPRRARRSCSAARPRAWSRSRSCERGQLRARAAARARRRRQASRGDGRRHGRRVRRRPSRRCSRGRCSERAARSARAAGEKAVLFLNRRGFASFLLCRECGFVPECASCSVSLTYPRGRERRWRATTAASRSRCPPRARAAAARTCGSSAPARSASRPSWPRCFPELPVVRMDADTTDGQGRARAAPRASSRRWTRGVLLGTQMIAKGLDYPEVTLVGVINADTTLHLPDFRAAERTYQLLEQVAGRAGQGQRAGPRGRPDVLAGPSGDPRGRGARPGALLRRGTASRARRSATRRSAASPS